MLHTKKGFGVFRLLFIICAGVNLCAADNVKFSRQGWSLYPKGVNVKFEEDNKISDDGRTFGRLIISDMSVSFSVYTNVVIKE